MLIHFDGMQVSFYFHLVCFNSKEYYLTHLQSTIKSIPVIIQTSLEVLSSSLSNTCISFQLSNLNTRSLLYFTTSSVVEFILCITLTIVWNCIMWSFHSWMVLMDQPENSNSLWLQSTEDSSGYISYFSRITKLQFWSF